MAPASGPEAARLPAGARLVPGGSVVAHSGRIHHTPGHDDLDRVMLPGSAVVSRFLFLTQYYPPEIGAPQVRLSSFARELRRLGHDVEVVTAMPNHPTGRVMDGYRRRIYLRETADGVTVRRTWIYAATGRGVRRLFNYGSFSVTCLLGLVRSRRPDVIFVESPPPFLAVPAVLAGLIWRRPIVFNVADLWPDSAVDLGLLPEGELTRFLFWFEAWTYRRARWVNAVTEGIRDRLIDEKHVPANKVTFLPNGVDVDLFRPAPPDEEVLDAYGLRGRRALIYAGTVGYAQRLVTAVDAMAEVRRSHPDAVLVIVGDGSERADVRAHADTVDPGAVRFIDPVPLAEVAHMFRASWAGLAILRDLPLLDGARPSKMFPVMASGIPVVYSGAGEGARLVTESGAGLDAAPENPAALAAVIRALLDDPDRAAAMGRRGRQLVEAEFSWGGLVRAWLAELGL